MTDGYCHCPPEATAGNYRNQETVTTPRGKIAGVDRCILSDVQDLWARGMDTIESCCGHGRTTGYIAVREQFVGDMLNLGYRRDPRTDAPGVFLWPKDESPLAVGKVYAVDMIWSSLGNNESSYDIVRAWKAIGDVLDTRDWRWRHVLQRYLDGDPS